VTQVAALEDERVVEQLVRNLLECWNRRDAKGFAEGFSPAAEYVTGSGQVVIGAESISDLVRQAAPAARVSIRDKPEIDLQTHSGTVRFAWASREADGIERNGTITCGLIRDGTRWLIDTLRNDEHQR
jgi:uncharacterized protein DUF4440